MKDERNCATCAHRYGLARTFWQCQVTGYFCKTEATYGGKCVQGGEMKLWTPRKPLHRRIIRVFVGAN
jgi:hypothetical protein